MSRSVLLSGIEVRDSVFDNLQSRINSLKLNKITPGLAVVLVGDSPASKIYVNSKSKAFKSLGLHTETFKLPSKTTQQELTELIAELNQNKAYHGILVQLPLPSQIDSDYIVSCINPEKDVDGFHPNNAGLLSIGKPRFIPCTPKGIMRILSYYKIDLQGKHIVVVGRSNIVGRPISILTSLKNKNANGTTTICHSGSVDIPSFTKNADIIIVALGVPEFLTGNMIKKGSVIVDVGINRVDDDSERGYHLVGDIKWDEINGKASAVSPVPGGVGPMTIAMLVENTIEAAEALK